MSEEREVIRYTNDQLPALFHKLAILDASGYRWARGERPLDLTAAIGPEESRNLFGGYLNFSLTILKTMKILAYSVEPLYGAPKRYDLKLEDVHVGNFKAPDHFEFSFDDLPDSAIERLHRALFPQEITIDLREGIERVLFNNPATVVFWKDGSKTVVKAHNEAFDPEKGLAMAICKKFMGGKRDYADTFAYWIKKEMKAGHLPKESDND